MLQLSARYFDFDSRIGFRVLQIQFEDVYSWIRGAFPVVVSAPVLVMVPLPVRPMHWNFEEVQSWRVSEILRRFLRHLHHFGEVAPQQGPRRRRLLLPPLPPPLAGVQPGWWLSGVGAEHN